MTLRALQNPVRSARIVGHKGNTLTLEVDTERGRYRWEVRPVRNFQMLRIERDFKRDWKAALKELIAESVGVYPTRLNSGRSDGWIYHPDLSTPNAQVFSKRMAPGHVIGVHQTNRGADWFVYERRKTVMRGASNSMSYAMRHAEDAYRQWQSGKPRMMFNPKPSKAGWTWTPHHSYRNVWHGNHREFAALVEKSYGEYWEWRVWKVRTAKDIGSGREETRKGAFREVEKASRKYSGFLFNEKSRWKNIGAGEYARSFHGFALRVRYGRVFRRYNWEIYRHGAFKVADEGSSDSFPGAKKAAEQAALSRRTLFNPMGDWLASTDWQRNGSVLQRRMPTGILEVSGKRSGDSYRWSYWQFLPKTEQYRQQFPEETLYSTENSARVAADKWYSKKFKGPAMLFNPLRYKPKLKWKKSATVKDLWTVRPEAGVVLIVTSRIGPRLAHRYAFGVVRKDKLVYEGHSNAVRKSQAFAETAYVKKLTKDKPTPFLFNAVRR